MSNKQLAFLLVLIVLSPIETFIIAMLVPFLLIGGFGLVAFGVIIMHLLVFAEYNDRHEEAKIPRSFIVAYAVGAFGLSLLAIRFIYPRVPESLWLWSYFS